MIRNLFFFILGLLVLGTSQAKPFEPRRAAVYPRTIRTEKDLIVLPRGGAREKKETNKKVELTDAKVGTSSTPNITTADVVKAHGYCCLLYAIVFALESFDIEVPYIGMTATMEGYNAADIVTKFLTRFLASLFLYVGFTEIEMSSNEIVQKYFKIYHIPAAVAALKFCSTNAKEGILGWSTAILTTGFCIAGIIT
jgi:hypothetical protein